MPEASDYFLTEEQLRKRFEERVREFVFSGYAAQESSVLVLLGGQPAAGKSQATAAVEQRHPGRQLVPLTGDELRAFHPQYEELLAQHPQLFPNATGQASGAWVRMSIEHARANGYSLLLEGVFRDPEMTVATAEEFAAAGYRVEVVGLGVREERSRLDSLHRYLDTGRWTPPTAHDGAYRMLPQTIAAVEASNAVQHVTITDRTGTDLYVNERAADERLEREPAGAQAVAAARTRPMPPDEAAGWLTRQRDVLVELAARGEITELTLPVLRAVTHDADALALMTPPQSAARLKYAAQRPLLNALVAQPLVPSKALPLILVPDHRLSAEADRRGADAERQRRLGLAPENRAHEDTLRRTLEDRLSEKHPPSERRPARPSSTAARARSTTTPRTPGAGRGTAPAAAEQPPHLRRPASEPKRGHGRSPGA